jgi:hypothetical protein
LNDTAECAQYASPVSGSKSEISTVKNPAHRQIRLFQQNQSLKKFAQAGKQFALTFGLF